MATPLPGALIASAVTNGTSQTLFQQFAVGIPMPFWTLKVLTVLPPTGFIGLNHAAMGNQALAILKTGSVVLSVILVTILLPYYPDIMRKYIIYLSYFGPWFMFDILEVFNTGFQAHGFRLPLNITLEGLTANHATSGDWKLTTAMASAIIATFGVSGAVAASFIPADLVPASISNNIALASGGVGLALGGVALMAMLASSSGTPPVKQSGGGSLPPLSDFADKLLKSKSPDESYAFLSVLGLVVMGGMVMAWSKQ